MNLFELFVKIGADTSQAEKGMKNTQKNSETLTNKIKVMSAQFEAAQKNVDKLTQEFNESVKKTGATSKETQELAKKLDDAEKEAEQAKKALDGYNSELGETEVKAEKASGGLSNFASKLGKGLATAAKIGTAAVGAAAAGIAALTTAAVNNYAEYEQLVGGVETLFKDSADAVQKYASNAYKTAGLSANEYMSTVTSFSASLLQSLGGDTQKAADYADLAVTDMADNANKMGTSMEMLQTTYAGFAKQNFTMLDNLKLGYGGTKTEMERLLADAEKISGIKYDISSFADITQAIHVMQEEMGIAGATAAEASTTIEGSVNSMKAAWSNLVTGIADENAEFGTLVNNFVESAATAFDNILPRIEESLYGVDALIYKMFPIIMERIPQIISDFLPRLVETATMIVQSIVDGISQNQETLMTAAFETITYLANSLISMLPQIVKLGLDLIVSLAMGIAESLPELIPTIIDVILEIVNVLTNPKNLSMLLDAALTLVTELAFGLVDAIPALVDAVVALIENLVLFLLDPENISKIWAAAIQVVIALATGLVKAIPKLAAACLKIISSVFNMFKETNWGEIGKNIIDGLKKGISRAWDNLKTWFKNLFGDLIGIAKKILGIASPSKAFKNGIGKNIVLGLKEGIEGNAKSALDAASDLASSVYDEFSDMDIGVGLGTGDYEIVEETVDFSNSALGVSSAGVVNGLSADGQTESNQTFKINLVLPDGTPLASYLLDPLVRFANANGTPILNPI